MAQDSSWLRKPMYGVGALLRGYGFGVPLEDEDEDGKKSGKSSMGSYASKTRQNAKLRAQQIMDQKNFANQQETYSDAPFTRDSRGHLVPPDPITDSGAKTGDTILRRALGMDGTNQPALHVERNAEGTPTRVTPNYFMTVDKDNMRAQGLANKWIGAEAIKDRSSIIKEALNRQKGQFALETAESNTAKAATQATIAENRLINVQIAGDKAQIALTRAKLDLAARKDALNTDKTLRTAKEVAAVKDAEMDVLRLQKLRDDAVARELTKRNKAADRLTEAQEKETKRLAEIEKQKRADEKVAFKKAVKAREQDTKDAEQFIKDEAKAAKAMAGVVEKEKLAEEKAQKYLLAERMKAYRGLSKADQKLLSGRVFGEQGSARAGFDAAQHIAPGAPTTKRPDFSLKRALMGAVLPGTYGISPPDVPIPESERERLGPVSDEDWTRMVSQAEMGVIMDSMWRMAVNIANQKQTNAQDEFSRLNLLVESGEMSPWEFMPGREGEPMDIKPLSEDDLLRALESGKPLGNEPYKVQGMEFKWDPSTQKFIRVQTPYNQVG